MYCRFCGREIPDGSTFCPHCGEKQEVIEAEIKSEHTTIVNGKKRNETLAEIGLIFAIIATVIAGFAIIPLCWMLPMTISINNSIKEKREISLTMKVCSIIFLNVFAGLFLILADEVDG